MEKLTLQEEEAMIALWKSGRGSIKEIMEYVADKQMPYTTFASTLKNLEKKSFVGYRQLGNVYEYFPVVKEEEYKKVFMKGVVKNYFENSYKELVSFFAEEKKISADELKEIIKMIEGKK